jgi:hypothetical protein
MTPAEKLPLRIHVLRRFNPIIVCVLRSPLHGLLSKRLLVLEYCGRKTGATYTIPLGYVTHAGAPHCVTRDTQWWKSAVSAPTVTVWLHGERFRMNAERLASTSPDARAAFEKFLADNAGTASLIYGVRVHAGKPDAGDVEREIHNSNIVRFADASAAGTR